MVYDPVRWGILGAGLIARVALAPAFEASDRCRVVAVGARDRDRARDLVPAARTHGSYADVIADPGVEAVYIALANDAHVPWAVEALRAGKHVLCEKPLGLDEGEVRRAFAVAERAGLLLVEASWYRWHPRTRRAEAMVAGGELGEVRTVDAGFTFSGVADANYRMDPAMGGGSLYDVGFYALSAVGWATGWAEPTVTAVGGHSGGGVDLTVDATLRFDPPGAAAHVHCSFEEPERQWIEVTGSEGSLRFGAPAFTAWTGHPATLEVARRAAPTESLTFDACDPYRLMAEAVSDVVRGGAAWLVAPAESIATARAIDTVRAAMAGPA